MEDNNKKHYNKKRDKQIVNQLIFITKYLTNLHLFQAFTYVLRATHYGSHQLRNLLQQKF